MGRHLDNFVDLHNHSHYSIMDGFPSPEDMVDKAVELGRSALALTDHGSTSGHVLFEQAIQGTDIKPIYGLEAYLVSAISAKERSKNHVTLLAENPTGYRNLMQLVSRSHDEGFYYRASNDIQMLHEHSAGVIALSGCESSIFMRAIEAKNYRMARRYLEIMQGIYGDRFYIELQHFPHAQDKQLMAFKYAEDMGIPYVVTCDCHYLDEDDQVPHQLIMSIRDRCGFGDAFSMQHARPFDPENLLRGLQYVNPEIDWLQAMHTVADVAERIERFTLPKAPNVTYVFEGDKLHYVRDRCERFLKERGLDNDTYLSRLDRELNVISEKGYIDYFLVVQEIINWAKAQGIMVGPGRGSAASSVVCWGLGITTADPIRWGLLFERFVDPTRTDMPDIDIDFEDDRRGEVFQYIRDRYGDENVAAISNFIRFGGKLALNDAAKSFNIPRNAVEAVARHLPERSAGDERAEQTIEDALHEPEVQQIFQQFPEFDVISRIQGKIKTIGRHACGMVVTSEPISNYAPIITTPVTRERVLGLDWRDAAYLNLMKIDILGLKELSMLRMMAEKTGMTLNDIYDIPLDDPEAMRVFNDGDFLGIFQFDGLAVRSVGANIRFDSLMDIAAVNAIARPGPMQSGATAAYAKGQISGTIKPVIDYAPAQEILAPTYGQIIYQETVMRILREIGGLDWGTVNAIRSLMAKSKGAEAINAYWDEWNQGCKANGVPPEHIERIWETIKVFGRYAFNVSHAVVYGLIAYWGAYLKAHYPTVFYWAHLVKTTDDLEIERLIIEMKSRGILFGTLSLSGAERTWSIHEGKIVPGWELIPGIGPVAAEELCANAPYTSIEDMASRCNKRKVNSSRVKSIEAFLGKTVEDIYQINIWDSFSERTTNAEIQKRAKSGKAWDGYMLGKVKTVKKKSRKAQAIARGKEPPEDDKGDEYATLTVFDNTGFLYGWVSADRYEMLKDVVWKCEGEYVVISAHTFGDAENVVAVDDIEVINMAEIDLSETRKLSEIGVQSGNRYKTLNDYRELTIMQETMPQVQTHLELDYPDQSPPNTQLINMNVYDNWVITFSASSKYRIDIPKGFGRIVDAIKIGMDAPFELDMHIRPSEGRGGYWVIPPHYAERFTIDEIKEIIRNAYRTINPEFNTVFNVYRKNEVWADWEYVR